MYQILWISEEQHSSQRRQILSADSKTSVPLFYINQVLFLKEFRTDAQVSKK